MSQTIVAACIAASCVLLATAWGGASSPVVEAALDETPPGIEPGKKIYWVQTRSDTLKAVVGPTPVEIIETRGAWALVNSSGINFGPIWLNFDEVLHYKTEL